MNKTFYKSKFLIVIMVMITNYCLSQSVMDSLYTIYINDITGTWEDGKGTKIIIEKYQNSLIKFTIDYYTWDNHSQSMMKQNYDNMGYFYQYDRKSIVEENKVIIKDKVSQENIYKILYSVGWEKSNGFRPYLNVIQGGGEEGRTAFFFDFIEGMLIDGIDMDRLTDFYPVQFRRTKIDGVSQDEKPNEEIEYALKVTPTSSDILPDGQSSLKIAAQLYSYKPDDNDSSKPLAGKTLTFEIQEMDGIKPGKLSSATAVTDANGVATVIYTSPTVELLEKMRAFARGGTSINIRNDETGAEDIAYLNFITDKGEMWVEPSAGIKSDSGFVPPDKRYPATINIHFNNILEPNAEVTFLIKNDNSVGMLRSSDGSEGKQITVRIDSERNASIQYFYASSEVPEKQITETIEAKTKSMSIPLEAYVSTCFNIVLENAETVAGQGTEFNSYEKVPLKITVKDDWNPSFDLSGTLNYWGWGNGTGENKLYVKLLIEKQGFAPNSLLDLIGEQNHQEPLYEELLIPKNLNGAKNILYIPEYSLKEKGFPVVKPMFSGTNNYEIRVLLVDENGEVVYESHHPRAVAYISIPTGLAADDFSIWFASNPLGPHTEEARFFRMILGTVTFGKYGGIGSVISLADAAFAINKGDPDALANIMLSEIKNTVLGDISEKTGIPAEMVGIYNNMAIAEQYISFALTTESDKGLIAQMESKILSGIADAGFGEEKQMIVLKGNGNQKLFIDAGQKSSKKSKGNFNISISGIDQETKDIVNNVGNKLKGKGKEIPCIEGKFDYDDKLNTISLKNGNVSIYCIPAGLEVTPEDNIEIKIY